MSHCECGNVRTPRTRCCTRCQRIEDVRTARPSEKLLHLLRRQGEWMLAFDIALMADADGEAVSSWLAKLTQRGEVEQVSMRGVGMVYRAKRRAA